MNSGLGLAIVKIKRWRRAVKCSISDFGAFERISQEFLIINEREVSNFLKEAKIKLQEKGYEEYTKDTPNSCNFKIEEQDNLHEHGIDISIIRSSRQYKTKEDVFKSFR